MSQKKVVIGYKYGEGRPYVIRYRFYSKKTGKRVSKDFAKKKPKSVKRKKYYVSKETGQQIPRAMLIDKGLTYVYRALFYSKRSKKRVPKEYAKLNPDRVIKRITFNFGIKSKDILEKNLTKNWRLLSLRIRHFGKNDKWIKSIEKMKREATRARVKLSKGSPDFARYLAWAKENDEVAYQEFAHL